MSIECTEAREIYSDDFLVGRRFINMYPDRPGRGNGCEFRVESAEHESVTIRDLDLGGMSVADAIEGIILRFLVTRVLTPGRRLFFYDPAGELHECPWKGPDFSCDSARPAA